MMHIGQKRCSLSEGNCLALCAILRLTITLTATAPSLEVIRTSRSVADMERVPEALRPSTNHLFLQRLHLSLHNALSGLAAVRGDRRLALHGFGYCAYAFGGETIMARVWRVWV